MAEVNRHNAPMTMLDKLKAASGQPVLRANDAKHVASLKATKPRRTIRERMSTGQVEWSPDLERIIELPRRPQPDLEKLAREMTAKLKRPEGTQTLRGHQAWCLSEFPQVGGGIAPLAVGSGKTLIGMLMAMVMPDCKRAVLFLPPGLVPQFEKDWVTYGKHWKLPNLAGNDTFVAGRPILHVLPYSKLSNPASSVLLDQIRPDLFIADEVHNFKHKDSVKTVRFLRHCAKFPEESRLCGWSGTIASNSIRDFSHLFALGLMGGSPTPIESREVDSWARALDPSEGLYDPGALMKLCVEGENARSGFRRRMIDTAGIVATGENALETSIVFYRRPATLPEVLNQPFRDLRRAPSAGGWKRPDGELLVDAIRVHECARQLACGFYYYWHFPRNEPAEVKKAWFARRQDWNRELRAKCAGAVPYLDTPSLCENAAYRWYAGGCGVCKRGPEEHHQPNCTMVDELPLWAADTYPDWIAVRDTVEYQQRATWISDYLLEDAAKWAQKPGIIWVEHTEFGHKLAKLTGLQYYGQGEKAAKAVLDIKGDKSVIFSIDARYQGHNMQMFSRNLIISFAADEKILEQAMGRTHREGQTADEVEVSYYEHTAELQDAKEKAIGRAHFNSETMGTARKLVYGSWSTDSPE